MKRITLLFLLISVSLLSQEYPPKEILQKKNMSQILNYDGDKNIIKKIIIEDSIKGIDYSEGSEWREFRTLDKSFPNIEAVEIWTDQDIPEAHPLTEEYGYGLFNLYYYLQYHPNGRPVVYASLWLKYFSALNVKKVGAWNFHSCENLISINFPKAEIIRPVLVAWCFSLTEINCPNAKYIGNDAFFWSTNLKSIKLPWLLEINNGSFIGCNNLESVSFGTNFEVPTEIYFDHAVFGDSLNITEDWYNKAVATKNIELILGDYVLPKPDTIFNTWQGTNNYHYSGLDNYPYIWKKITSSDSLPESEDKFVYYLGYNEYRLKNIERAWLFDLLGRQMVDFDEPESIDLSSFATGVYFLKYSTIEQKIKIEKLIKH